MESEHLMLTPANRSNRVIGKFECSVSEADLTIFQPVVCDSGFAPAASAYIDPTILRATALRTTLKGFGVFWRSKGNYSKKERLWQCSFPCERISLFLSHSWAANGTLKFLACLLHSEVKIAAIALILSFTMLYILTLGGFLPDMGTTEVIYGKITYACPVYLWSSILPSMFALVVLFFSPVLPCSCRSTPVFLDMLCIHQVNEDMKMQGVRSLAGFLARSDKFMMLWSEHYFSRLWCVFEVAAFRRYRPTGKVIVRPISIVFAHLVYFVAAWISSILYYTIFVRFRDLRARYSFLAICFFTTSCISLQLLRPAMRDKLALRNQLFTFDCRQAACFDLADRGYIVASITRWFGNEESFNSYVRGPLRKSLERKIFACPISYRDASLAAVPFTCGILSDVGSFYQGGVPAHTMISWAAFCVSTVLGLWPLGIWVVFYLAERFCSPRASFVSEIMLNMALGACTTVSSVSMFIAGALAYRRSIILAFLYGLVLAAFNWVLFRSYPKRRARHIDAWFSKIHFRDCFAQSSSDAIATTLGGEAIEKVELEGPVTSIDQICLEEGPRPKEPRRDTSVVLKMSL